jgi:transposase
MEIGMPWTETTRAQYRRESLRYASDLTDAEWSLAAAHLPACALLGRPREVELRDVVDAILYIASTGCQWRQLPKVRIPTKPATNSNRKPATDSDLKPAGIPI